MRNREVLGTGRSLSFRRVTVVQKVIQPKDGQAKDCIKEARAGEEAEINPFTFFDTGFVLFVFDKPKYAFGRSFTTESDPAVFLFSVFEQVLKVLAGLDSSQVQVGLEL